MQLNNTEQSKRVSLASMLIAIAVVGSLFSFPILGSRSAPIQHLINVLAAIMLGPGYAVGIAFGSSLLRNLLGWGTLLAFPGSMFGALLAGLFFRYSKQVSLAFIGEVLGTSIFGGLAAYVVAGWMGITDVAFTAYIFPFFLSTIVGSILAVTLYKALDKRGIVQDIK